MTGDGTTSYPRAVHKCRTNWTPATPSALAFIIQPQTRMFWGEADAAADATADIQKCFPKKARCSLPAFIYNISWFEALTDTIMSPCSEWLKLTCERLKEWWWIDTILNTQFHAGLENDDRQNFDDRQPVILVQK